MFVLAVAKAIGEVHHVTVWQLDVELLIGEVEDQLDGGMREREREKEREREMFRI